MTTALLNPFPLVDPVSTSAPSDCTPNGFTAKHGRLAPIVEGAEQDLDLIVGRIRSRSASVAWTAPCASKARMPK